MWHATSSGNGERDEQAGAVELPQNKNNGWLPSIYSWDFNKRRLVHLVYLLYIDMHGMTRATNYLMQDN